MSEVSDLPIERNDEGSTAGEEEIATDEVLCVIGDPKSRINGLTPPVGTMFHGHRTYTLWDSVIGGSTKWGHVSWVVDAYTYASGADPRHSDFAQKGGKIHCVLVSRGYVKIYDNFSSDTWNKLQFMIKPNQTGLVPMSQLPPTGSGSQQGDDYQYTIDFEQRMPMLRNQGNEAFDFDAKYKETFGLTLAKQSGSRGQYIEIGIETTKSSSAHRYTDLYGVSVLTHTNPRAFPLLLDRYFKADGSRMWAIGGQWHLHLGFSLN